MLVLYLIPFATILIYRISSNWHVRPKTHILINVTGTIMTVQLQVVKCNTFRINFRSSTLWVKRLIQFFKISSVASVCPLFWNLCDSPHGLKTRIDLSPAHLLASLLESLLVLHVFFTATLFVCLVWYCVNCKKYDYVMWTECRFRLRYL